MTEEDKQRERAAFDRLKWSSDIIGVFTRIGFLLVGYHFALDYYVPDHSLAGLSNWTDAVMTGAILILFSLAIAFLLMPLGGYIKVYWKIRANQWREGVTSPWKNALLKAIETLGYLALMGAMMGLVIAITAEAKHGH